MREVGFRATLTRRLARAAAIFGLSLRRVRARARRTLYQRDAREIMREVRCGDVVLVTGPSGGGKSTLLRSLGATMRAGRDTVACVGCERSARRTRSRSVVDSVCHAGVGTVLEFLARAGLADATILARLPSELSAGQRFRLELARGFARLAPRGGRRAPRSVGTMRVLVVDEFASNLDRETARSVSYSAAKWCRGTGAVLVAATAHADVERWLAPDVRVRVSLEGGVKWERCGGKRHEASGTS